MYGSIAVVLSLVLAASGGIGYLIGKAKEESEKARQIRSVEVGNFSNNPKSNDVRIIYNNGTTNTWAYSPKVRYISGPEITKDGIRIENPSWEKAEQSGAQ